jgi:hypothetical protein
MSTEKFPSNDGLHTVNLNSPKILTDDRSVTFPDGAGTIPVSEYNATLEQIFGRMYVATLFQTRTDDPIATLLTPSTLGLSGIVWTRSEPRIYKGTLANAFTIDGSTECIMKDTKGLVSFEVTDVNTVTIEMEDDEMLCNRRIQINVL